MAVALLALLLPLSTVAAGDSRMAGLFSTDEQLIADGVYTMVKHHTVKYRFFWYPPFFMMCAAGAASGLERLGLPLATAAVVGPRVVASLAHAAAMVAVAGLGRSLSGRAAVGLVAAGLFASTPELFRFAFLAHPDTLQIALLVASAWLVVGYLEHGKSWQLMSGSAVAGLAFVTKYAGAFLVPPIAAAIVWRWWRDREAGASAPPFWRVLLRRGGGAAAAFVAAGIAGGPTLVLQLPQFVERIRFHSWYSGFGAFVKENRSGAVWLQLLADRELWGPVVIGALGVGGVVLSAVALRVRRRTVIETGGDQRRPYLPGYAFVAVTAFGYLAFLIGRARMFELRYLFPISGAIEVLAVGGLVLWPGARGGPVRRLVERGLLVLVLALGVAPRLPGLGQSVGAQLARVGDPCLAVGRWLLAHVPTETALVYDMYTYVPAAFVDIANTFGLQERLIEAHRAPVVITNDSIRGRYRMQVDPEQWFEGPAAFLGAKAAYAKLERGELGDLALVAEFPECRATRIYASRAWSSASGERGAPRSRRSAGAPSSGPGTPHRVTY